MMLFHSNVEPRKTNVIQLMKSESYDVMRCQVYWSKRWSVASHHVTLSVKQHHDVIPSNQTSLIISPLDRNSSYHVQVNEPAMCIVSQQSVSSHFFESVQTC